MPNDTRDSPSADAAETDSVSDADGEQAPNTLLNAFIGGVVGILLSFVPFSTVLGGGVAGYLEGGEYASGAKVGALAGVVAFVPFVLIVGVLLFFLPVMSMHGPRAMVGVGVAVILVALVAAVYTIGLGAVGGVLGVYVKEEI